MTAARSGSWSSQVPEEVSSTGSKWARPEDRTSVKGDDGGTNTACPSGQRDSGLPSWIEATPARRNTGTLTSVAASRCRGSAYGKTDSARSTVT
ncbi:hypothetical protein [Nonomuraea sp. KM88]|uniref:hypothetical protein n=1 Tax=Nonomuraea sp. KM88 TaxID=3457427 RepID=UPI003FCC58C8